MNFLFVLFLIVLFTPFQFSQEKQDSLSSEFREVEFIKLQEKLNEIDFYMDFKSTEKGILFNLNPETIWLWTYQSLKHSTGRSTDSLPAHISLPLYRQYMEDSKFNPIRMALGVAQLGATGYLAYKAIRKYGFLK